MTGKLYRSRSDKKLFGLCGGLSDTLGVDSTLLRLIVVVTIFFTGGVMIPIYFIAALMIPKEPAYNAPPISGWNVYGGMGAGAPMSHDMAGYPQGAPYHNGMKSSSCSTSRNRVPQASAPEASHLDEMMQDIEKKAMWKEIQDLKTKLSNYEKGEV
ncbi:MAG: hypothetical protein K0R67_871 [Paenibacillus sp.]|nr:hypothetical protein [Paenibacillus sp.]